MPKRRLSPAMVEHLDCLKGKCGTKELCKNCELAATFPCQRGNCSSSKPCITCAARGRREFIYPPSNPSSNGQQDGSKAVTQPTETPIITNASTIVATPVSWLWKNWIPRGAPTLLDGNPGQGKSTICVDTSARASRGWQMPPLSGPCEGGEPEEVLLLSAEDDPARTIRPRLDAAGADVSKIHIFTAVKTEK